MSHFRIGDLARLGGVSVRMLRHYHEIGLLVPSHIDDGSGYRFYRSEQLDRLRRIVALKSLGIPLAEVAEIIDGRSSEDRFVEILTGRRDELLAEVRTGQANLDRINRQLATLEPEQPMITPTASTIEVELKPIPERLVAQHSAVAESWAPEHIGPVIRPLYPELIERMERAGVAIAGPSTAWYEDTDDGRVHVHATLTIDTPAAPVSGDLGFEVRPLPAIPMAATTIHRGTMDNCDLTYQALLQWVEAQGHKPIGYSRELDIECGPDNQWIIELQLEIEPGSVRG